MSQNPRLVIDSVDLTKNFNRAIKLVDRTKIGANYDGNAEEAFIQLAVIKLRLCRWKATLMPLILAKDKTVSELTGPMLKMYLGNIEQILKFRKPKMAGTTSENRIHSEMVNWWLKVTLNDLSLKHQGWGIPDSQASSSSFEMIGSKEAFGKIRAAIVTFMENLEQGVPQHESARLRQEDAATLVMRSKSNQKDLFFLQSVAATVDRPFAECIQSGGHQFNRTTIDNYGRAMLGDEVARAWPGLYQPPGNLYNDIIIKGNGQALLGNRLGQTGSWTGDRKNHPIQG
jgi:hypothetical protein